MLQVIGMTVVIIDFLEEINVKHHEGYRFVFFLQEVNGVVEFSFNASVIERFWRSICRIVQNLYKCPSKSRAFRSLKLFLQDLKSI